MRVCAKMHCGAHPIASIALRYPEREVLVSDLASERDPNLLELCREHLDRMSPPRGWIVRDSRASLRAGV